MCVRYGTCAYLAIRIVYVLTGRRGFSVKFNARVESSVPGPGHLADKKVAPFLVRPPLHQKNHCRYKS